jgi:hypothetical protein
LTLTLKSHFHFNKYAGFYDKLIRKRLADGFMLKIKDTCFSFKIRTGLKIRLTKGGLRVLLRNFFQQIGFLGVIVLFGNQALIQKLF